MRSAPLTEVCPLVTGDKVQQYMTTRWLGGVHIIYHFRIFSRFANNCISSEPCAAAPSNTLTQHLDCAFFSAKVYRCPRALPIPLPNIAEWLSVTKEELGVFAKLGSRHAFCSPPASLARVNQKSVVVVELYRIAPLDLQNVR